ncbi:hypothetical protein [Urbifossiella limnaea]|uniref:hypothetical protein n=1 Tax=Urbifossiella limnaea TaxID=2528023 RepID=UPI00192E6AE4|nr:hypothetical protein [Urbifossiella limnaea]
MVLAAHVGERVLGDEFQLERVLEQHLGHLEPAVDRGPGLPRVCRFEPLGLGHRDGPEVGPDPELGHQVGGDPADRHQRGGLGVPVGRSAADVLVEECAQLLGLTLGHQPHGGELRGEVVGNGGRPRRRLRIDRRPGGDAADQRLDAQLDRGGDLLRHLPEVDRLPPPAGGGEQDADVAAVVGADAGHRVVPF